MSFVLLALQGVLALVVVAAVVERARCLLFRAPVSAELTRTLTEALASGRSDLALRVAKELPECWASRVVIEASPADGTDRAELAATCLADLRVEAEARLGLIRVSATLASTMGLMAGILAIQRGFSGHGLLALSQGLAQRVAMSEALTHMAIGIGTAAFSFAAFGLLRKAARDGLSQASQVAARCGAGDVRRARRA